MEMVTEIEEKWDAMSPPRIKFQSNSLEGKVRICGGHFIALVSPEFGKMQPILWNVWLSLLLTGTGGCMLLN